MEDGMVLNEVNKLIYNTVFAVHSISKCGFLPKFGWKGPFFLSRFCLKFKLFKAAPPRHWPPNLRCFPPDSGTPARWQNRRFRHPPLSFPIPTVADERQSRLRMSVPSRKWQSPRSLADRPLSGVDGRPASRQKPTANRELSKSIWAVPIYNKYRPLSPPGVHWRCAPGPGLNSGRPPPDSRRPASHSHAGKPPDCDWCSQLIFTRIFLHKPFPTARRCRIAQNGREVCPVCAIPSWGQRVEVCSPESFQETEKDFF